MFFSAERSIWLWIIPLLLMLRWGGYFLKSKRLRSFVAPELWREIIPTLSKSRKFVKVVCVVAGLIFVILAYMRPQFGQVEQTVVHEGTYVVIAVDTSKSMLAEDLVPNRLAYAKREIRSFIDQSEGDRIGLIVFSGNAFVHCPFTTDYEALKLFVDDIRVGMIPRQGTNLAAAIRRSRDMIGPDRYDNGAIIIFSDGEFFEGNPMRSAEVSGEVGVPLFVVGLGSEEGHPIPLKDDTGVRSGYKKDREGQVVLSRLNRSVLESVAESSGGRSFFVSDGRIVSDALYKSVSVLEGYRFSEEQSTRKADQYQWFLVIAFFLLLLEFGFSAAKKRVIVFLFFVGGWCPVFADLSLTDYLQFQEGNQLLMNGQPDAALSRYVPLLSQGVSETALAYNLGMAFYKQNDFDQAEQLFSDVQSFDNSLRRDVALQLGNVSYGKGDYQEAVDRYRALVLAYPNWVKARHNLELALEKLSAFSEEQKSSDDENSRSNEGGESDDEGDSDSAAEDHSESLPSQNSQDFQGSEEDFNSESPDSETNSGTNGGSDYQGKASEQVVQQFLSTLDQQEAEARKQFQKGFVKGGGQVSHDW